MILEQVYIQTSCSTTASVVFSEEATSAILEKRRCTLPASVRVCVCVCLCEILQAWPQDRQAGFTSSLVLEACRLFKPSSHASELPGLFLTMATFGELENKIRAVQTFLENQKPDLEEKQFTAVRATQLVQVMQDIVAFTGLDAEQATNLSNLIRAGPWTVEDRAALAGTMSNMIANNPTKSILRRPNQDVTSFSTFFSQKDLDLLKDASCSLHTKADQITTRLVRIQLWLPSEQAWGEVIKTAKAAGLTFEGARGQYDFLQLLKKHLKAKSKRLPKIPLPTPFPSTVQDCICSYTHNQITSAACILFCGLKKERDRERERETEREREREKEIETERQRDAIVYIYIYVYMYVCMYVCIYVYIYISIYVYVHASYIDSNMQARVLSPFLLDDRLFQEELPQAVRDEAYTEEDPPVAVEASLILRQEAVVRKSSLGLRSEETEKELQVAKKPKLNLGTGMGAGTPQEMFGQMAQHMVGHFANAMMTMFQGSGASGSGSQSSGELAGFQLLNPPKGKDQKNEGILLTGAHLQSHAAKGDSPDKMKEPDSQEPLQSDETQQQPQQSPKTQRSLLFQLPDTSGPTEKHPEKGPMDALQAASVVEKAVGSRQDGMRIQPEEEEKDEPMKKPAAAKGKDCAEGEV